MKELAGVSGDGGPEVGMLCGICVKEESVEGLMGVMLLLAAMLSSKASIGFVFGGMLTLASTLLSLTPWGFAFPFIPGTKY